MGELGDLRRQGGLTGLGGLGGLGGLPGLEDLGGRGESCRSGSFGWSGGARGSGLSEGLGEGWGDSPVSEVGEWCRSARSGRDRSIRRTTKID